MWPQRPASSESSDSSQPGIAMAEISAQHSSPNNMKDTNQLGCCGSPHTKRCCYATVGLGGVFLLAGIVLLVAGPSMLEKKILATMALSPGSDRLQSWLVPPVQAHLTGYAFHVVNPEEVQLGGKPVLQEVGPFVYKAVTVKDSVDQETRKEHLEYNQDGETLTYSPRKFYFLDREASVGDPDTTMITVPNIPLLTAFRKVKDDGWTKATSVQVMKKTGLGTPFITVSFSGLLWGYHDELPCFKLPRPDECGLAEGTVDIFSESDDDDDDWDNDDGWKRKKRETTRQKRETENIDLRDADFDSMFRPKAEVVDCKCQWGLFRDRNVTLRKPLKIHHGMADLSKKGWVEEFNSEKYLKWWKPESECDKVGGQDSSTLPPAWKKDQVMDMFISLMCRRIKLEYEKDTEHNGLTSYRFIPPENAMGSHTDPDPKRNNPDNACFCLKEEGFSCFKSGVFNMEPCKRTDDLPLGAPIALSYPHFYQADPSYLAAVEGLSPDKEKHQFYVDVLPEFGFPLAIRPRFQLNAIIRRDEDIDIMSNFADELVLPFLWAQDGFSEPSEEMAAAIKFGLEAPNKLSSIGGGGLLGIGLVMVVTGLVWVVWDRKRAAM